MPPSTDTHAQPQCHRQWHQCPHTTPRQHPRHTHAPGHLIPERTPRDRQLWRPWRRAHNTRTPPMRRHRSTGAATSNPGTCRCHELRPPPQPRAHAPVARTRGEQLRSGFQRVLQKPVRYHICTGGECLARRAATANLVRRTCRLARVFGRCLQQPGRTPYTSRAETQASARAVVSSSQGGRNR